MFSVFTAVKTHSVITHNDGAGILWGVKIRETNGEPLWAHGDEKACSSSITTNCITRKKYFIKYSRNSVDLHGVSWRWNWFCVDVLYHGDVRSASAYHKLLHWAEVTGQLELRVFIFEKTVPGWSERSGKWEDRSPSMAVHEPRPPACD
jgi:hypothetical protein